jgi:hypothetical protein
MSGFELGEPAFYAYHYPEPPGLKEATILPEGAAYHPDLGEFILRYDDARRAADPGEAILNFFQSTYDAAATLAGWDRQTLEGSSQKGVRS